ncbi:SagB family peptide dehydrogenase [Cupriavidus necator]|uniref:SagB family peptide dehydrogenase n=1 Tax=Cupriavidus necator TaxID=106590 RepID=UPI003ECCCF4C
MLQAQNWGHARQLFEAIEARLPQARAFERAVVLERIGQCLLGASCFDAAMPQLQAALTLAQRLAPARAVGRLVYMLHAALGDGFRASGDIEQARQSYEAALAAARNAGDAGFVAQAWHRLGKFDASLQRDAEASLSYAQAASAFRALGDCARAAQVLGEKGACLARAARPAEAIACYREALDLDVRAVPSRRRLLYTCALARLLVGSAPAADIRRLVQHALEATAALDPDVPEIWHAFGVLADVAGKQAVAASDAATASALRAEHLLFHGLHLRVPQLFATLTCLGEGKSFGAAVVLGRLGHSLRLAHRLEQSVRFLEQALATLAQAPEGASRTGLAAMLQRDLGDALLALDRPAPACHAYEAGLAACTATQDLAGQAVLRDRLADAARRTGATAEAAVPAAGPMPESAGFRLTMFDETAVSYVFDSGLLIDGVPESRQTTWTPDGGANIGALCPTLVPFARSWADADSTTRFALRCEEPAFEPQSGCILMRATRREVAVAGAAAVLAGLLRAMDGEHTVAQLLDRLSPPDRCVGDALLRGLADAGVIDLSGRAAGRLLHTLTKKGVLPGGGLDRDAVLHLATDGGHRAYAGAPRTTLGRSIPAELEAFHAITRARRSQRAYTGLPVARQPFDALLQIACGATGILSGASRDATLRAYPSSGGLYAVEIYPVILNVEGLPPAIYHLCPNEGELERVRPLLRERLIEAMLPAEREMISGCAALICLTGYFPRHEYKYGEGGYRMLVAESGHLSQNLILAATALGLSARPFGGVFDALLNHVLGLDPSQEQFLLAVALGHAMPQRSR